MNTFCAEVIEPETGIENPTNFDEANEAIRKITGAPDSQEKESPKTPPMYACVLHNDPVTPYQFVVEVLRQVFGLNLQRANALMLAVHGGTRGVIVIVAKDQAETYLDQINTANQAACYNLQVTMEPETDGDK